MTFGIFHNSLRQLLLYYKIYEGVAGTDGEACRVVEGKTWSTKGQLLIKVRRIAQLILQ